jgi:cytochrome c oxidase assembly protein subunit 15
LPKRGARRVRIVADVATVALFLVVLVGFLDTLTHSALGCGPMWPLCNGGVLPGPGVQSLVEYTHRAITGVAGILVAVAAVWAWVAYRAPEVRVLAAIGLGFVVVESGVGALAVVHAESPAVLATHFGFALFAFAGTAVMTAVLHQLAREPERATGWRERTVAIGGRLRFLIWLLVVYLVGIAYLGALVAHTGAGTACVGWPLCSGMVWPGFAGLRGLVFFHRLVALGAGVLVLLVFVNVRSLRDRRPGLYRASHVALALVVLQIFSGAYLVLSHLSTTADLIHVAIMTMLFTTAAYMAVESLPLTARGRALVETS